MGAPVPIDEPQRLEALFSLKVLDTLPCPQLQAVVQIAADTLDVPIALLSLVDSDRQWFKARVGLDVSETCRDDAFCSYAILQDQPLIVEDATQDPRFSANPLVTAGPSIRFYAGAPLTIGTGHKLGTLCVIDTKPRSLRADQVSTLQMLASLAAQIIETQDRLAAAEGRADRHSRADSPKAMALSSFGHELRTPLNHIMGFADLMKSTLPLDGSAREARHREYLDIIRHSGAHLLGLIDNVIHHEQAAFEGGSQAAVRFDVNVTLAEVVKSFAGTVDDKQQALRLTRSRQQAVVLGDPTALRQIAINLIGNASKYSPRGASIDVSVSQNLASDRICLVVEDDGPGLPDDLRDSLCRPFVRGQKARDGEEEGFGLGLHITKRLSEAMKGSLVFERGRSGGTRAVLWLPVADRPAKGQATGAVVRR